MAKTLILVRHAKSSWNDPSLADFDRPLNERGKTDGPEMAKRLRERKIKPDGIVSSPAKRARQTARFFADEFEIKKKKVLYEPDLYEAGEGNFYDTVKGLKNKWDCVALFSHNPGITSFSNSLTETKIDDMPTCGMFAIRADTDDWAAFEDAKKEFVFFDYPRSGAD